MPERAYSIERAIARSRSGEKLEASAQSLAYDVIYGGTVTREARSVIVTMPDGRRSIYVAASGEWLDRLEARASEIVETAKTYLAGAAE